MPQEQSAEYGNDWFRYARAMEASQEGFWDWDLEADRLWGSSRWQAITGIAEACSPMSAWIDRVHPYDKPRFEADLRAVQQGRSGTVGNEHRVWRSGGEWRWVTARGVVSRDESGRVTHVAGSLTDNTETRTADPLTGLPNRLYFLDHLEARLERARQMRDWNFAVLSLALDRFDRVNEMLGPSGADRLMLETAQRLQASLPGRSVAARLNGAEFVVCLDPAHSEAEAMRFAETARAAFRQPFVWRGSQLTPQLAIGIARADAKYEHPDDLVGDAESALANARREEPPGVVCYSRGMRERALARMQLEADLEKAIRQGELTMYYQPEVDLRTNRIVGFEALVRWRHARRGLLPPRDFIPLAEETGLILPMGDWSLAEATRQLVKWRNGGRAELSSVRMSVNLSARQFEQPDLVQRVQRVLRETGLGPGALRLEVTESSLIADAASATRTMRGLGELGVGLHMDDFGVGYSSLHNLQRFPFDTLKIDRSFVQGVVDNRESHQIVRNILDLARSFGMDVVAEGIEDAAQLEALKSMGCPCGQGYYFAKPMAPASIDAMMQAGGLTRQSALAEA
jgi:diguanylate cyclase (GGDEF)-like protein/PAS domain S-box-containing protein